MSDLRKAAEAVLEAWDWDWSEPRNEALRERMEALRQALAQPEWVGLTEWMPIETAPKNGTEVLVMYVHIDTQVVHNGFWLGANDTDDESDIGWWSYEHSEVSRIKLDDWMTPTHWLPLPTLKEKNT